MGYNRLMGGVRIRQAEHSQKLFNLNDPDALQVRSSMTTCTNTITGLENLTRCYPYNPEVTDTEVTMH